MYNMHLILVTKLFIWSFMASMTLCLDLVLCGMQDWHLL